jgi:hypothetical protein
VLPVATTRAARAPFAALVIVLLGGGLVSLLLLNTALALHDLQRRSTALTEQAQSLQRRIADEQQPGALARRARALGMVSGGVPAFLQLPDGAIIGTPHAAAVPTPPAIAPGWDVPPRPLPTASPSAKPAATKPKPAHRHHRTRAGAPHGRHAAQDAKPAKGTRP